MAIYFDNSDVTIGNRGPQGKQGIRGEPGEPGHSPRSWHRLLDSGRPSIHC